MKDFKVDVAVLDGSNAFVGVERIDDPTGRVIVDDGIDLPRNGTYKWDAERRTFVPLGFGFGKPTAPPVPDSYALFSVIRGMGDEAPLPARAWADWYDKNMRRRDEESFLSASRKQKG